MELRARDECYRCHKALVVCVCSDVPKVSNKTEIVILQHPREQFHAIGTVRFAKLGLERVRVVVHHPREGAPDPAKILGPEPGRIGLLYPSDDARVLSDVPSSERPEKLLVLDGTWSQAKTLHHVSPWLTELPRYVLAPKQRGQYRIRAEPDDRSLSTIEAIVQALEVLEPDTPGLDELMGAFTRMIDRQIEYSASHHPRLRTRRRPKPRLVFPPELQEGLDRLVLAYGEFALPPEGPGRGRYDLVYWTAVRWDSGEPFHALARPPGLGDGRPGDQHLRRMGLARADVEGAEPAERVRERWRAFLKPGDVLAAWNRSTFEFLGDDWLPPATLALKTAYQNVRRRHCGHLSEVLEAEGLVAAPRAPFVGRAARNLGELEVITRHLIALARTTSGESSLTSRDRP
ncbi:DTW domain-containing protein [Myxococcota bacterium]|nr:DTW domain-containing protein [Myxococcota bacterium]